MTQIERSSNIREEFIQKALMAIVPGVIAVAIGGVMIAYQSMFMALGVILLLGGLGAIGFGVNQIMQSRKVTSYPVKCPFCQHKNDFTEEPMTDVRCEGCQRSIPIADGRILQVWQVRCGYCNHLNYYSEKSTGLICENCDRIVPIANEGGVQAKATFEHFTVRDDDRPFDLVLTGSTQQHNEDLISTLQQMLALNRSQVKQLMDEVPVTLLTGVPKKKAELLKAQIEMHHGRADAKPTA